jgi:hypothetical protein
MTHYPALHPMLGLRDGNEPDRWRPQGSLRGLAAKSGKIGLEKQIIPGASCTIISQ